MTEQNKDITNITGVTADTASQEEVISSLSDPGYLRQINTSFIADTDPPLTKKESIAAISELSIGTNMVEGSEEAKIVAKKFGFGDKPLFTASDRHYVDPPLSGQDIGLFSFVPCKDAKPNRYGVYGYAKIRGSFQNADECDHRAAEIIQRHDSVHKIYHVKIGSPFPVVHPKVSEYYAADVNEINVKGDAQSEISKFVKSAGQEDKKIMEEIKGRERQLREEVSKTPEQKTEELTPLDKYIFARKRLSDNLFVFVEHRKKLHDVKKVILKAEAEANELEASNPEVLNDYKEKYDKASKESGVDKSNDDMAVMIRENFYNKPNLEEIFSKDLV